MKKFLFFLILFSVAVGLLLVGIKALDLYLQARFPPYMGPLGTQGGPVDPRRPDLCVNTFDLYPFTGGHTQPHFQIQQGRVRSGAHGFNIDFDPDNPPAKGPGEYRVILVGGSAAWGWGASKNEAMLHKVMERKLNELTECREIQRVSVTNLAMNGSSTMTNFVALNLWGHKLEPDLIVSFSGANDIARDWPQGYSGYWTVIGLVRMANPAYAPPALRKIARYFPGIMHHTGAGLAIRSFFLGRFSEEATEDFLNRFPKGHSFDLNKLPQKWPDIYPYLIPNYVRALKSIKRDFLGIPIVVAFQPIMSTPENMDKYGIRCPQTLKSELKAYEKFRAAAKEQLDGYLNSDWLFFDAHDYYHTHMAGKFRPDDGIHLSDEKSKILGEEMARRILPLIRSSKEARQRY